MESLIPRIHALKGKIPCPNCGKMINLELLVRQMVIDIHGTAEDHAPIEGSLRTMPKYRPEPRA